MNPRGAASFSIPVFGYLWSEGWGRRAASWALRPSGFSDSSARSSLLVCKESSPVTARRALQNHWTTLTFVVGTILPKGDRAGEEKLESCALSGKSFCLWCSSLKSVKTWSLSLSLSLSHSHSLSPSHTHTHTHTHLVLKLPWNICCLVPVH